MKPPPHQYRPPGLGNSGLYVPAVENGAQHMDSGQVDAGQGWSDGPGAGGQNQGVIGLQAGFAGFKIAHFDLLCGSINAGYLGFYSHLDIETVLEQGRRRDQQAGFRRDDIAHEIGQATVGKRDMMPAVNQDDLAGLAKPAGARRAGGAAGHAADDQNAFFSCGRHVNFSWES